MTTLEWGSNTGLRPSPLLSQNLYPADNKGNLWSKQKKKFPTPNPIRHNRHCWPEGRIAGISALLGEEGDEAWNMHEADLHQWLINSSISLLLTVQFQQQNEGNSALNQIPFIWNPLRKTTVNKYHLYYMSVQLLLQSKSDACWLEPDHDSISILLGLEGRTFSLKIALTCGHW